MSARATSGYYVRNGIMCRNPWPSAEARFHESYIPEPNSGCWLWVAGVAGKDYGAFSVNGEDVYAHRFSYELHVGPIPDGLVIDHKCRVHCCVNPQHLEPVTNGENILRGVGPDLVRARAAARTHCRRGHELTPENIGIRLSDNTKICRECERQRRLAPRRKEAQSAYRKAYNQRPDVKEKQRLRQQARRGTAS